MAVVLSPATQQLIDALCCLQGVGPKTAQRMAFQLLSDPGRSKGQQLTHALSNAIEKVALCQQCRCYTEFEVCQLCRNPKRQQQQLCVVESAADIMALEETHCFQGLYFVLHGHLSPLDGIGPAEIAIPHLLQTIKDRAITELIIATNPTMEGKATTYYIVSHVDKATVSTSQLAHGIPLGGELEYLDGGTLAHALQMRTAVEQ